VQTSEVEAILVSSEFCTQISNVKVSGFQYDKNLTQKNMVNVWQLHTKWITLNLTHKMCMVQCYRGDKVVVSAKTCLYRGCCNATEFASTAWRTLQQSPQPVTQPKLLSDRLWITGVLACSVEAIRYIRHASNYTTTLPSTSSPIGYSLISHNLMSYKPNTEHTDIENLN
jgi:hypothetical protein